MEMEVNREIKYALERIDVGRGGRGGVDGDRIGGDWVYIRVYPRS
jgi:hypothetical protein